MSAKNYWIAFSIGVAAGAGIALLYAPQTGTRARKRLRRGVQDAGDSLRDAGDYLKAQAERLSGEAQTIYGRGRSGVNDALDSASSYAGAAAKQVKSLV